MRVHATLNESPMHEEIVEGCSLVVPGQSISVSEIVRRQSLGLPLGVGVHGVTDIPEGMDYEAARREALYYVHRNEAAQAAAAQAAADQAAAAQAAAAQAAAS